MSQKIRCANPDCRRVFLPDPRVQGQRYCRKKECQRVRKKQWQRQKFKHDPDYRDNQRDAQHCWLEQNRDYWRRYRDQHPGYVKRNRFLQRERDRRRRLASLAKMDASKAIYHVKPDIYCLVPANSDLAKMDALSPQYYLIPKSYPFLAKKDQMDLFPFLHLGCTQKEATAHDGENHPLSGPGP